MIMCNGSKCIIIGCSCFVQEGSGMNIYLYIVLLFVLGVIEGFLRYVVFFGLRSIK